MMCCFLDPGTPSSKRKACKTFLGTLRYVVQFCEFDVFDGLAISTAVSPSTLFKVK